MDDPQRAAETLTTGNSVNIHPTPSLHTSDELEGDEPCFPSHTKVPDVLASVAKEAQYSGVASAELCKRADEKVDDLVTGFTTSPTKYMDDPQRAAELEEDEPCFPSRTKVPDVLASVEKEAQNS